MTRSQFVVKSDTGKPYHTACAVAEVSLLQQDNVDCSSKLLNAQSQGASVMRPSVASAMHRDAPAPSSAAAPAQAHEERYESGA